MLEIKNLVKIYRGASVPAVNDITFTVGEGEIFGFIGIYQ